ncbi:hypothetical protein KCP70_15040 [Salmonella enterica subsp. enterica]|nr:hypothetical protein KCP70_15040 [Salmonella enterica subsp. enterica]
MNATRGCDQLTHPARVSSILIFPITAYYSVIRRALYRYAGVICILRSAGASVTSLRTAYWTMIYRACWRRRSTSGRCGIFRVARHVGLLATSNATLATEGYIKALARGGGVIPLKKRDGRW